MADTLESIELEIKHSALGADAEISKVTRSLSSLGKVISSVLPKLEKLAVVFEEIAGKGTPITFNDNHTTQVADSITNIKQAATQAQKATTEAASGVNTFKKSLKDSSGPLTGFLGSLKRIAMYRFLRTIIKNIAQGFSEGLKNAYHWSLQFSKSVDNTLAQSLDNLSSKSLTMKNQMGAAFGALLQTIMPIVLQIISLITRLMQAISALFAAIGGGQYLVAKDVKKGWDEATGAAKEYKKTILGFDEINRLDDNSGGGGGGTDVTGMFEEGDLPDWAEKIKAKLEELREKLDFTKLQESWERLKESAQGLADVIERGLGWVWDNVLVPLAQWTINELAPRLVELLASALDFLRSVLEKLGPLLEPLWENVLKPFFEWCGNLVLDGLDELIDLLEKLTKLIDGDISWDEFVDGLDGVQWALLALGGVAVLTAIGKVTTAIAKIPGTIASAIPKMATNLGKMAKTAATGALAVFDGVMVAYDVVKLKEAADTFHEAQLAHNNEMDTALSTYAKLFEENGKEAADQWAAMVYQIDTTNMSFEEAQQEITKTVEGYWEDTPQNMWDGFKQGWKDYFGEDGNNLWTLIRDAFNNVIDWLKDLLGIHSPSTVFEDIAIDIVQGLINGWKTKWDEFLLDIRGWWDNLKLWWDGLSLDPITATVKGTTVTDDGFSHLGTGGKLGKKYASGGFPDMGEVFVAREAGPEMIGTIGGRTAVANNDDIVAGISNGVYDAVSSAMGNQSERPVQVRVYLDSREIRVGQNRLVRAMGV